MLYSLSKNLYIFENGVWGVAPRGVRAAAPHSAPARIPGVYAQGLCKDAKPTKHTQPFTTGKGFGVRDREFALSYKKTDFFYKLKHGEKPPCFSLYISLLQYRTHRLSLPL